ncbi:MAG: T9SS type A sorting domain-containing protein [Bacteroidales bacterium]|nr:T9SS type A sorting domain-containing protein [Bacteroidales bacterium]
MKKTILLTIALLLSVSIFAQNRGTLIQETFDGKTLPKGWSIFGGGNKNWSVTATDKAGGAPNELDFFWDPDFTGTSRFATPAINLTGISSIAISFKHYFDYYPYYDGICTLGIATSSDNGATWNTGWSQVYNQTGRYVVNEIIETDDMGKENVMICIYFEGSTKDINSWQFDDILIFKQEEIDAEVLSINTDSNLGNGNNDIVFSVRNLGKTAITSFKAKFQIEGESEFTEETFSTNMETFSIEQFTFETPLFANVGEYKLNVEITSVNDNIDNYADNNIKTKDIDVKLGTCQRIPMIEHFSSSTCFPCVFTNKGMDTLTDNNPGKYTYVKYPMNGPSPGDPYYISDCGTRRSYYNVNNVPTIFLDGNKTEDPLPQEKLDRSYNTASFIDIRGSFKVNETDNTINIIADIFSYSDIKNVVAYLAINEKTTTENIGSNGETEFHHILMKLLTSNAKLNLEAGKHQRLEFTHDMSLTNVEELSDLEVAIWIQNYSTKEIYNSRFAYEYSDHVYPAQNLNITTIGDDPKLKLTWEAPEGNTPDGYNIIIDGIWVEENFKELTFIDENSALNVYDGKTHYVEIVAVYENGKRSVSLIGKISDVVSVNEIKDNKCNVYPNPVNDILYIETQTLTQTLTIEIYDVYGRLQDYKTIRLQDNVAIDVENLKSGIYFVKISTEKGNIVKRIIKQ